LYRRRLSRAHADKCCRLSAGIGFAYRPLFVEEIDENQGTVTHSLFCTIRLFRVFKQRRENAGNISTKLLNAAKFIVQFAMTIGLFLADCTVANQISIAF
jgi:hypothetical protein